MSASRGVEGGVPESGSEASTGPAPGDPRPAERFLVDTHAHLGLVAERLGEAAIAALDLAWRRRRDELFGSGGGEAAPPFVVDVGTEAHDFTGRKARFGRYPWVRLSAGAWPGKVAREGRAEALAALREAAADPACVAVGECGLDYFHDEAPRVDQLALFQAQADLARERGLPLIVHSRDAFEDSAGALREAWPGTPVVIHCFGYDRVAARAFLDLGCYVSFAGNVTYRKAEGLKEALAYVPDDRLLLETDAPYLAPEGLRGKAASPLHIERTYRFAAGLRNTDETALEALVARNAARAFSQRS